MQARFLYAIGSDAGIPLKIGIASDPLRRLRELQIGSPVGLSIHALFEMAKHKWARVWHLEQFCHEQLRDNHLHGEWFKIKPTDVKKVVSDYSRQHRNWGVLINPAEPIIAPIAGNRAVRACRNHEIRQRRRATGGVSEVNSATTRTMESSCTDLSSLGCQSKVQAPSKRKPLRRRAGAPVDVDIAAELLQ